MTTTEIKALCDELPTRGTTDRFYFASRAAKALKLAIEALERIDTPDDHPNIAGAALNKIEEAFR